MSFYENNLKVLKEYYPDMDILIEEAKEKLECELTLIKDVSYDGKPILKVEKDGKVYYFNGKRNTEEPAKMWVKGLGKLVKNSPIFMMGIGNSTYLEELVKYAKSHLTIIIYEPSMQIFLDFLENVDLAGWMEKHLLVFWVDGMEGMDEEHMTGILEPLLRYELMPFSRNIILPNYDMVFPKQALSYMKMIRNLAFKNRINYNTQKRFSAVFVKNVLNNLPYLLDAYKTTQLVEVIPRDIPGIVVAAGPSLNKNIEDLKLAKGKAFIIAVDTAIKPLINAGIIPDMFVVVDGEKPLSLIEKEEAREIPLVGPLCAASEIFEYHRGMKFFYNEGVRYAERIYVEAGMPLGDISTGGSVATHAFSLLYKIGLKSIILVGQDLALTNNKTHADGTFQEKMDELDTKDYIKVEGNYEKEVPTRMDFKVYLEWYGEHIKGCKKRAKYLRVINATEGGAKIQHTEVMPLRKAIEEECQKEVDIKGCLKRLEPMLKGEKREWAEKYINNIPEDFKQLAMNAAEAIKWYHKLDKICGKTSINKKEYLGILKEIEKIVDNVESMYSYQLVSGTLMNAEFILKNEQFLEEDSLNKEGKEIARKGILYMENIKKCAKLFEELMHDILKKFMQNK